MPLDRIVWLLRQNETWLPTGPFGCIASRYLAEMARHMGLDKTAEALDDLKFVENGEFKNEGYDKSILRMTDKAGQTCEIDRRSLRALNDHMDAIEDGTYSLVRLGSKWHMHGVGLLQRQKKGMISFGEVEAIRKMQKNSG